MDIAKKSLEFHKLHGGKIGLHNKVPVTSKEDLTLAYTPGVAAPCLEIEKNPLKTYDYTAKNNWVAIVTNGTAVLGLGDIGPDAALPVMEGKAVLFKAFGGVDGFPILVDSKDNDEIVRTVKNISKSFGGINLEDIKAPECFEIERRLKEITDIPVFHDDQHGTAIVVLAATLNALKLTDKRLEEAKFVINGAGSAGISIAKLLLLAGVQNIIMCDLHGTLVEGDESLNEAQKKMAKRTNRGKIKGSLKDALRGADVFIGVSGPNVLGSEDIKAMNEKAIVFALANPVPEITPDKAKAGGAFIVGTGRSDYNNQINNVLAFPGIFRGALDVRASCITEKMKLSAAYAISSLVDGEDLTVDNILPMAFDKKIAPAVAREVARAAIEENVAKSNDIDPEWVYNHTVDLLKG